MSTNNFNKSDLFGLYDIVQFSMVSYPKEIIIATLRDFFSKDSYYHYARDQWGFANTTDHTDLPPGADLPTQFNPDGSANQSVGLPTRLFIGENYRFDGIYYPAILVKSGGGRYVQVGFNRNQGVIRYDNIAYEDGYGNTTVVTKPVTLITAGAWEGSVTIDVMTRSLKARDELVEAIAMCFTEVTFDTLVDVGLIIKPISFGAASETDDRNDKLFRQTLTLEIRTEWRREIPVGSLVDAILFTCYFQDLADPNAPVAANLTINTETTMSDMLLNL
jgi:hypothetical protein